MREKRLRKELKMVRESELVDSVWLNDDSDLGYWQVLLHISCILVQNIELLRFN